MYKAVKYRIYPNREQKERLSKFFGCTRFIYNAALATRIEVYRANKTKVSQFELCKQMKDLKNTKGFEWLKDAPSQSLQVAILNVCNAYQKFFKGGGFPKFKNKFGIQSVAFPQKCKICENGIITPKLKYIKAKISKSLEGKLKTVTITKTKAGRYFASCLFDNGEELPEKVKIKSSIGLDMGIKDFCITSDGEVFENQKYLINSLKKLRVAQRSLSRKSKGSNRRKKQKLIVAKIHEKIANQRKDYLHKLSTRLVKEYDLISVEDLNIKGMVKNGRLAKYISDAGWSLFFDMLKYKCELSGKHFIKIDRWFPSSKTCSCCGHKKTDLTLKIRKWICENCGTQHDRDINAAININKVGLEEAFARQRGTLVRA